MAATAVEQITDVVEDVHSRIAGLGSPRQRQPGRTRGITSLAYKSIRLVTSGSVALLRKLDIGERRVTLTDDPRDARVRAVVNGIIGDHLAETNNALAIPMVLRHGGKPLSLERAALAAALPDATNQIVVLIHGLCMNHRQWDWHGTGDHGQALARDLGYTPLYLHYNTGLHISSNGQECAALLEALVQAWPVPVERLAVVGHSMGGMVARSACHYAAQAGHDWLATLRKLVFLATPHHGSQLERAGNAFETALAEVPYAAPLARLGRLRSAGITDLRYGNLLDEDWQGRDRFTPAGDTRGIVPLPAGVECYTIAAARGHGPDGFGGRGWGDGLVPLGSALGEHAEPQRVLPFEPDYRWIAYRAGHLDLLHRADVYEHIRDWLGRV